MTLLLPLLLLAQSGYRVDPAWPKKPADVAWGDMPGVAVDRHDQVWIFTRAVPAVQVYAPGGELVRSFPDLDVKSAHHIRIDPEGNVWLADVGHHTVTKMSPEGRILLRLGTPGEPGEDDAHFDKPTDVAVTPQGDVFIADGYGNNRIVHVDRSGRVVKTWGRKGKGPGEFDLPHGIGVDSKGRVYVADRSNQRIQVFTQDGRFVAEWPNILVPWSIWITPADEIWTCGSTPTLDRNEQGMRGIPPQDQVLARFDASGKLLQLWSPPLGAEKPGRLSWVHAVAVDSKGRLYAGDIKGRRVQRFLPSGD